MFWKVLALSLMTAASASAQRMTGAQESAPPIGLPQTLFEQFASRLRLDGRTQRPQAEEIFTAAAREALPVAQQMNQHRIQLVNAEIGGNPADAQAAIDAYTAAAARMAEIEAQAFGKVYALLTPDQHNRTAEAFQIMAGVFIPSPAPARGGRRGGGR
jgi:hypothetical protein